MKNKGIILVLFLILISGFSLKAEKVIYFAKVMDVSGDLNMVANFHVGAMGIWKQYLQGYKGDSWIDIPLSKIKRIDLLSYSRIYRKGLPMEITLTNGEKIKIVTQLVVTGFYGETEFASNYYILQENVKWIELLHDGKYKKCPICNTIFYNAQLTHCTFCKEKLDDQ